MPYGILKCDQVTFTNAGVDQTISVSGIVASISGNITATGTISGNVIRGGTTISGATVTGTAGQFGTITGNTAGFTTVTGTTVTGSIATFTSGAFTYISGGICTLDFGFFTSGTAASPSITFQNDLNTGIYSPGADQVAISTAGSGRLFVNSSGQVGIGATPGSVLDVRFPTSPAVNNGPGSNALRVFTTAALAANAGGAIALGGESTTAGGVYASYGQIAGRKENATSDNYAGYLQFAVNASDGTMSERLRITSAGLVGVGVSAPSSLLHTKSNALGASCIAVENQANTFKIFEVSNAATGDGTLAVRSGGGVDRFIVDSSGRVGVAVASPATSLHVGGSSDQSVQINGSGTAAFVGTSTAVAQISSNRNPTTGAIYDSGRAVSYINLEASSGNANIQFYTTTTNNVNATERARIDSSGRLLVGTSSNRTGAALQVEGTTFGTSLATITNNSANSAPAYFQLIKSRGTSVGSQALVANGDGLGNVQFVGTDGTQQLVAAAIEGVVDGTPGANDMPGRLVFSTTADGASSPTERMRIDSAGLITAGSGGVNGIQALLLNSGQINTSGGLFTLRTANDLSGGYYQVFRNAANTIIGTITQNGTTAVAYNTSSDYRLKENVAAITDGIPRLLQLKPSQFNFIADPGKIVDGFLAHEAQAVVPECVTGEKDAVDDDGNPVYQGIDQSKLVPLLTAALQEAIGRIELLEAEVAALKAQ